MPPPSFPHGCGTALRPPPPSPQARIGALHRDEPGWRDAYLAYLQSGGYECRVGPERIRTVSQPTLVLWGEDDPILDPNDAQAFARDLRSCAGVRTFAGCQHSPHLDDPRAVADVLAPFLLGA